MGHPLVALCFADYRPRAIQTYARQHGSAARENEPEPNADTYGITRTFEGGDQ
ncbi:hypothetical protein [Streptomyces sp. Ac-502]|uniref:hypothetical protein n=1 Tax=Streptomyces sp. Ac-502 TaxID=3342801 RepID=UPI003862B1F5